LHEIENQTAIDMRFVQFDRDALDADGFPANVILSFLDEANRTKLDLKKVEIHDHQNVYALDDDMMVSQVELLVSCWSHSYD
jgi:hypothetical protein